MLLKNTLLVLVLTLLIGSLQAQTIEELNAFNVKRNSINTKGMPVLAAWGFANVAVGVIGTSTTCDETDKYFHQMNLFWGGINLALATVGYYGAKKDKKSYDLAATVKKQQSIEKTFLFNAALDAVYISAGAYLLEKSTNSSNRREMYNGYGQSLILQGAFLLGFDAIMYLAHTKHGKNKLIPLLEHVKLSNNGIGVYYSL